MLDTGLDRDHWKDVIRSLEEFLPYYERVNSASTFFQLNRWRRRAAEAATADQEVLEIGPGPGEFAKLLEARRVYLLEPSTSILRYSKTRLDGTRYVPLLGIAERIPLTNDSVDEVFCIFSFRDFMDKQQGLMEICRILRPGGGLHIVDLFRAPQGPKRELMELWLERGAPRVLRTLVPQKARKSWSYDPYRELMLTYRSVGGVSEYEELMRKTGFSNVRAEDMLLESVCLLQGERPSTT